MQGALSGKRILLVEDEYFIAADLARALESEGAEILGPFSDVQRAQECADAAGIDVAVLDINLEGARSYPVAEMLDARDVPYLFVTGYDEWALPERFRDAPRLAKPFHMNMVIDEIARLVVRTGADP